MPGAADARSTSAWLRDWWNARAASRCGSIGVSR
ncbi:Uncharacterised protein [Bordetella pertussis]|nr:Uncharacterised protein [Bordetella pertussis]